MASFWESAAERAGYALAAVVMGPYAAAIRRERRVLRGAFHAWLDELHAERLEPRTKGFTRRSASLRGGEPIPFEAELDPFEKRATVDVAIALGKDVSAEITKARWLLDGRPYRVSAKRIVGVDATSLDEAAANELVREIAESDVGRLDAFLIDLRKDRVVLDIIAPRDVETWKAIERALAVLVQSWSGRWTTYR
jgi:hypothetical protein